MAKRGNSVIGIDLGKRAYKAVLLNKKSDTRYALTSFASHEVPEEVTTADDVAQHIKQLLKDLGGFTKSCALAVSEPGSLLRIIEQPNTPPELLRNALRYNGLSMLNQDCKDFVLDVASISNGISGAKATAGEGRRGCCRSGPGPGNNADSLSCRRAVAFKGERNLRSDGENPFVARANATGAGLFF